MFRIYYAGKRSIPTTNEARTERTDFGNLIVDLSMGYDWFVERGHILELEETHTYVASTTLTNPDEVFEAFQGEFASQDFCEMIRESDATHTSMSVGDVLVEVGTGVKLFCDRQGWREI